MATEITGSGKVIDSRMIGFAGSHRVSPVVVLLDGGGERSPGHPSVFGSMATEITGSGKVIDSRMIGFAGSHRVSPVV
ncbi:hypothetical protein D9B87_12415, partial [Corynebacterium diphtheriae]